MMNERPSKSHLPSGLQLQDIINFLPDATFVIDRQRRVIVWNHAMEELTGISSDEILGRGDYEYALPFYKCRRPLLIDLVGESDETIRRHYPDFSRSRDSIIAEAYVHVMGEGGAYLWAIAKPLYDSEHNIIGAIESLRDITDRKQADETIRLQKQEMEVINQELAAAIQKLRVANAEYRETNERLEAAQRDYIAANERLRDSEEKFATVFRLSPVVLALSTVAEGLYVEVSDFFYTVSGYTREEVIGRTSFDLNLWVNPEDRSRVLTKLTQDGRVINEEILFRDKWGEIHTMYFSAEFITIHNEAYLLSLNVDITDRKQAQEMIRQQKEALEEGNRQLNSTIQQLEEANFQLTVAQQELVSANEKLRYSEEKFSKAFHLGPIINTLSTVSDGSYVEVSDYFLAMTGYTREEVIGKTSFELNIWARPEDRTDVVRTLTETGVVRDREISFRSRDGNVHDMLFSAEIITIDKIPHIVSVAIDVSERKRAEEEKDKLEKQLHQAQKMESIGRLAGGIAHDFNNMLTAIMGNTHMLMMNMEAGSSQHAKLGVVMKAAESAAGLTKQLLAFSRRQIIEPRVIHLNLIVKQMANMLDTMIGEDVQLKTVLHAATGKIKADPGQIEQIIINLAVNARDAMPDGGKLILETAEVFLDEYYCRNHPYIRPGDYILLAISDTGTGMTEELKKNLFEPFFTTKPKGKGTGLGLATVYGAVKQNNGCIEVYSVPNKGTSFKIYFPAAGKEGTVSTAERQMEELQKGRETILLVEDDALVRDFALDALNDLGYHVLQANSGEDAMSVSAAYKGHIDLLLTDVILTGINGRVLADNLKESRPATKVLFTSGYTGNLITHHGVLEVGIDFIEKPYSIYSLSRKIRTVLEKG